MEAGEKVAIIAADMGFKKSTLSAFVYYLKKSGKINEPAKAKKQARPAAVEPEQTEFQKNYGKGPVQYTCLNNHLFDSTDPLDRVTCPTCGSQDVEAGNHTAKQQVASDNWDD